ncbi:MAG: hypothetical protein GXY58_14350 [Planctomycetaceae bacterium]|mgnify:FL=1|nr:hypothetical protein [Planctomycetaceae bacterium]
MKKTGLLSIALAVVFALSANVSQASYIVNGSFEDPALNNGAWQVFNDATVTGWYVTSGTGIEIQNNGAVPGASAFDGKQLVELDSYSNSGMAQDISGLSAGSGYTLSFAYSPRPNQPAGTNGISVYWNNALLQSITGQVGGATTSWAPYSFVVYAQAGINTLKFEATETSDSLGGYIDDVKLVPEPAAVFVWGFLSVVGVCWLRRRSRA